jgi:P-type Ca2+ transporter type 2C
MGRTLQIDRIAGLSETTHGLSIHEVDERRRLYGTNDILHEQSSGWGDIVRDTARDPMVWFLAGTALLFAALGDYTEAMVLGLALLPIIGMDAYLHRRTQATTEGLAGRLASNARVLRLSMSFPVISSSSPPGSPFPPMA